MGSTRGIASTLAPVGVAGVFGSATAVAAPPANDQRTAPTKLELPASVSGTLVEATKGPDEPGSCGDSDESVWYEFTAPARGHIVVLVDAAGDLDAVVDIFRRA